MDYLKKTKAVICLIAALISLLAARELAKAAPPAGTNQTDSTAQAQSSLDFEIYRTRIEPILLKTREGGVRCYDCHSVMVTRLHLERLPEGNSAWTEQQSRQNFKVVSQLVTPAEPLKSRLLLHPLSPEAGGDPFHSGGRQFDSQNDPDWLVIAEWIRAGASGPPALSRSALIYVTNSAGDTIDVIDSSTNKVVQVIHGIELPHGIGFSPDGTRVYISNESENVLDVVDRVSGKILQTVPLSGRPNNLAITKDGGRVLVGIRSDPGVVDVIDTTSLKHVKSIPVDGGVHNVYITPDGKYAVSGSLESNAATVIDLQSEQAIWEVKFEQPVRPMAFETNSDGSTRRIFVQLSRVNGFAVVDFAKRAEVERIKFPDKTPGFGVAEGREGTPSHGIGVSPDGKSLWVNSTFANSVFAYSLPELRLIGSVELPEVHPLGRAPSGAVPEWITFTADSKVVYVSNSGAKSVTAIDISTLKIVALIPVGEVPKRLNTLVLH